MKQNLIVLAIFGLLLSCNQATEKVTYEKTKIQTQPRYSIIILTERQIIIQELKRLESLFASNSKEKIACIFTFPIYKESIGIYIDNANFQKQLEENNNKTSKSMFNDFYSDISMSLQFDQINQLFRKLDVENLENKQNLEHDEINKTEPCYNFYRVKIESNLVTLTVGSNSNRTYKSKSVSEDDLLENDSSICEYTLWWVFEFDGKQLNLKEISGAG